MKKILSTLIAVALSAPFVVSAADLKASAGKDLCLLNSANCTSVQNDSIQEKMSKLHNELQKGSSVYTAEELKTLASKQDSYQSILAAILNN
ncbi:hypothetical protein [Geobacter pickeringii]|uniref:Cytochrome C n=1 Tax=Geobacter pickeringii TaxID=345632 RepID=A0A0B5BEC3_9BACT|nr:hypothetical protein [Geobacter pickeringii]AJE03504.1 hypothetical protein GPICK_09215 [Geobacter pickeringii]